MEENWKSKEFMKLKGEEENIENRRTEGKNKNKEMETEEGRKNANKERKRRMWNMERE